MTTDTEIILRLVIAVGLGLVIGYERERQNQAAGLRTHMILVTGAALAMIVSINLAIQYRAIAPNGDPARLAAQVISGIGFLGAGAILRFGTNVKGLTTATSMWTMALVGLSIGAGYYLAGVATTAILFVLLSFVNIFEDRVVSGYNRLHLVVEARDRPNLVSEVKTLLGRPRRKLISYGLDKEHDLNRLTIDVVLHAWHDQTPEGILEELEQVEGVQRVKVSD